MTNERFDELFGGPPREPEALLDPARDGPRRLDPGGHRGGRAAADALRSRARPAQRNLCLAGGVALNCVANGKVLRDGRFDDIWIQPAAGDAGGALGAALAAYHLHRGPAARAARRRARRACAAPTSGPAFAQRRDRAAARRRPARASTTLGDDELIERRRRGARRRQGGRLVPGPHGVRPARARRPLDPRRPALARRCRRLLNLKVKYRESFRPFAPVGAARGRRRLVRARRRQPLHAAGRRRASKQRRRR